MKSKVTTFSSAIFKLIYLLLLSCVVFFSCKGKRVHIDEKEVVEKPEEINVKAEDIIKGTLKDIIENPNSINDSFKIKNAATLQDIYDDHSFQPLWSTEGRFTNHADSLLTLIDSARSYGLFPQDYYQEKLHNVYNQLTLDTSKQIKLDAAKWAYSDLLLSSAFVQIVKDIKKGRLIADSILVNDSSLKYSFFLKELDSFKQKTSADFASSLEPKNTDYSKLKEGLRNFLKKANFKTYTFIKTRDSAQIPSLVYKRLSEEDSLISSLDNNPDSITVAAAVKKYQKRKKLKADGKITSALISKLNDTDKNRFTRIAITLDKYKSLPPLPTKYLWVNIPSFYLQLRDSDSVVLKSKIVVGKPETRTPELSSAITDMITYPKWHIPESIIKKEILPGLKRDPGYTLKKGYTLFDKDDKEVDPYSVNWSKFKEGIPYKVVQGSGDENALGVLKFNFPNKYSVYLHDTNQRYLFERTTRALSHGCVRVQSWQDLAYYLLRNDSMYAQNATPVDSLTNWLILKEKHVISVRKRIPLFIKYFSCEGKDDRVVFYEDIYGEDRRFKEVFFADK